MKIDAVITWVDGDDSNHEAKRMEYYNRNIHESKGIIPKVIHYCWFGHTPLPQAAQECIKSWRKYMPDYEIKEWNESNFDVYMTTYTEEAYLLKKYAFVSDYARFWILYHYGGIYFDVDVELLKPIDDIIAQGAFMGLENMKGSKHGDIVAVNAGLGLAVNSGHTLYKKVLDCYEHKHFTSWNEPTTVIWIVTQLLLQEYEIDKDKVSLCGNIYIYPADYFDPMSYYTKQIHLTSNTRSIHHYAATWMSGKRNSFLRKMKRRMKNLVVRIFVATARLIRRRHHG